MTNEDLIDLLHDLCAQPREQQWLEFKSNGIDHEQMGEYISAMSNGQPWQTSLSVIWFGAWKTSRILSRGRH